MGNLTDLQKYFYTLKENGFNAVPLYNNLKYLAVNKGNNSEHDYIGHKATGIRLKAGTIHDNKLLVVIDFDFKVQDDKKALELIKEIAPTLLLNNKPYYEFTTSGGLHVPLFIENYKELPNGQNFRKYLADINNKLKIEIFMNESQAGVIAPSKAYKKESKEIGSYIGVNGNYIDAINSNTLQVNSFLRYIQKLADAAINEEGPKENGSSGCICTGVGYRKACFDDAIKVDELTHKALDKLQTMYENTIKETGLRKEYLQLFDNLNIDYRELTPVKDEKGYSSTKIYLKNLVSGYEDGEPTDEAIKNAKEELRKISSRTISRYGSALKKHGCLMADPTINHYSENYARTYLAKLMNEWGYSLEEMTNVFSYASNFNREKTIKFLKIAGESINQRLDYNVVFFNERQKGKATVIDKREINMKESKGLFYMLFKYRNAGFTDWLKLKGIYGNIEKIKENLTNKKEEGPKENGSSHTSLAEEIYSAIQTKYIGSFEVETYLDPQNIGHIIDESLNAKRSKIGIQAITGAGKTTSILDYAYNNSVPIVYLVPYTTNAQQKERDLKKIGRDCVVLYEGKWDEYDSVDVAVSDLIIATYDQLPKITKILNDPSFKTILERDASDYILVVDEYHNITAQQFRGRAIKGFLINNDSYKLNMYITATFEGINVENIDIYNITVKKPIKKANSLEYFPCASDISAYFYEKLKEENPRKALILYDNKFKINEIVKKLDEDLGRNDLHVVTAETKEGEVYQRIINESRLGGDGVYLCTSLLTDGINLLDDDIDTLYIVSSYNLTTIRQFLARPRVGVNKIKIFYRLQNIDNTPKLSDVESEINTNVINYVNKLNENIDEIIVDNKDPNSERVKELLSDVAYAELISEEKHVYIDNTLNKCKINNYSIRHTALKTAVSAAMHNTGVMRYLIDTLENIPSEVHEIPEEVKEEIAKTDKTEIYERLYDILMSKDKEILTRIMDIPTIENAATYAAKENLDLSDCYILRYNKSKAIRYWEIETWLDLGIVTAEEVEAIKTNENGERERIRIFKIDNNFWRMLKRRCNLAQNIMLFNSGFNFDEVAHKQRGMNAKIYKKILDYCFDKKKVELDKLKRELKAIDLKDELQQQDLGMKLTDKNLCEIIATIFECKSYKMKDKNGKEHKVYYIKGVQNEIRRVLENNTKYYRANGYDSIYTTIKEMCPQEMNHYDLKEELRSLNVEDPDKIIKEWINAGKLERPKPDLFKIA